MSTQEKLDCIRKPRVHIKYEVETEDGIEQKELPFVVGVIGDFSGNSPSSPKKSIRDRNFIKVDTDNLDQVMKSISPGVSLRVKNTLTDDDDELFVDLKFNSLEDFEPHKIVNQVSCLGNLMQRRNLLRDLLTKSDRSDELEDILESTIKDNKALLRLSHEIENDNKLNHEDFDHE